MAFTWTELQTKAQRLSKDNNADVLTQLKADMNEGYALFNAKLSRYFTRKQQFTSLVANQQIYQTPIDCVRITGMTVVVATNYQPVVKEIRSEFEWRQITSYPMNSNWPTYYYPLGNDEVSLWPVPSQDVTNGLRLYYQPTTGPLTVDDTTSTTTSSTVTITNGSVTVTASPGVFNPDMAGLWFQITDTTDQTWYEIASATSLTLTLKSAYTATSGSGHAFRVGQLSILPQQYASAPVHYALWSYFSSNGDEPRAQYHKDKYDQMVQDCLEEYSSSNTSNVITSDEYSALNLWLVPPPAG
jgi:hypothetical protein